MDLFKHLSTAPAFRVSDKEFGKIKRKAFYAMGVELEEAETPEAG